MRPLHMPEASAATSARIEQLMQQQRAQSQRLVPHLLRCKELQQIEPWRRFKLVGEAISEVPNRHWLIVLSSGACGTGMLMAGALSHSFHLAGLLIALPAAALPFLVRSALVRRVIREKVRAIAALSTPPAMGDRAGQGIDLHGLG